MHQKIIRTMWRLLFAGIILVPLSFFLLSFSDLPDTEELENPRSEEASEVLAADEAYVLGRYFIENRVPVDFDELSPFLEQALVSTEDVRFYEHSGIDIQALGRVFVKTIILSDRSSGGASTISQQLARLLFTGKRSSKLHKVIFQKLREWIIAVRLEKKYTKEEIIAMYLNKVDFLFDSYGIKAASETYFGKSQNDLNVQEAAMIVGMLKNPSYFNPKKRLKIAEQRRSIVLHQMLKNNLLSEEAYDSLKTLPVDISKFRRKSHTQGLAQYFRSELGQKLQVILNSDEAKKKPDGTPYHLYKDGLRIYTTIDPVIQQYAEQAMVAHMSKVQARFWNLWNVRKKTDPWDYSTKETTEYELRYRKWKLQQMVRTSERYEIMRDAFIGTLEEDLEREVDCDVNINDESLSWMVKDEFPEKVKAGDRACYRKMMQNTGWNELKKQWQAFQKAVEKEFNKPIKMRVFAYNEEMEKDTTMSPLDSLKYHHLILQIGSLAVDPKNGHVKAWVGGVNHKYFAFDHTNVNRQVGSTFKPFVYATAIAEQGMSPCATVQDLPRTIFPGEGNFDLIKEWSPQNAEERFTGRVMQLRTALKNSVNSVSVHLMKQLRSVEPVIELLANMGIDTKKVPKQPSICLGAADLSVLDMTGAYTTFANNGYYSKPIFILSVKDKNGRLVYGQEEVQHQALREEPNFAMVEMLKYVAGGMGLRSEIGGKTGTTNDYVDGWFMGITPSLVVGTWVGGEDRWVRFLSLSEGQGSRMAKPFCKEFLKLLEDDAAKGGPAAAVYDTKARFVRPGGDLSIGLDCEGFDNRGDGNDDEYDGNDGEGGGPGDDFFEDQFGTGGTVKRDTTKAKKPIVENEDFDGG